MDPQMTSNSAGEYLRQVIAVPFLNRTNEIIEPNILPGSSLSPMTTSQPNNPTTTEYGAGITSAMDIEVSAAFSALQLNCLIFILLMILYEFTSRFLPSVYANRIRHVGSSRMAAILPQNRYILWCLPLSWISPVWSTPWSKILECGGLDAYMFLRFIRMCGYITGVSGLWGMAILWPVFASGGDGEASVGWYRLSMAHLTQGDWRIWFPTVFMWLLTFYVMYLMNEEYKHFIEKRMDFLAGRVIDQCPKNQDHTATTSSSKNTIFSGSSLVKIDNNEECSHASNEDSVVSIDMDVHPQHQYSLMVEGIPNDLRSDKALFKYFNSLFPNKIHSAYVVLNIPDLEALSNRRLRVKQKLEKSVAYLEATGRRPSHISGRKQCTICDINISLNSLGKPTWDDTKYPPTREPNRGERVDSIHYYTYKLKTMNEQMDKLQNIKLQLAERGNRDSVPASEQISRVFGFAQDAAVTTLGGGRDKEDRQGLILNFRRRHRSSFFCFARSTFDFLFAGFRFLYRHLDVVVDKVVGTTMSSTGFVTFYDLASVTCAVSTPLSTNADELTVALAPEPRDLNWENAHIDLLWSSGRTWSANVLLGCGAILWSIPLTAIQAWATVDSLAQIPGLSWIGDIGGGHYNSLINGYLPVVVLLGLIMVLPLVFEWVAINYEDRKTKSDVQESILGRYFYFQLANIYITVTAGSILDALYEILDHPSNAFAILGKSLPQVVGYFVTLLATKTLAGLPCVLLRIGALSRMLFLKMCFTEKKLTQRELDQVYRKDMLMYGWEYPTQLLVIVICFTYACISPIILPVGAAYFLGALLVYKKQVLFVYTPTCEGGGSLFPSVCHRTLIGLICAQVTLMGYTLIRSGGFQLLSLIPLPILTMRMMGAFKKAYADNSLHLSLERAMALDRRFADMENAPSTLFSRDCYRQPVLVEKATPPLPYRRAMNSTSPEDGIHNHGAPPGTVGVMVKGGGLFFRRGRSTMDGNVPPADNMGNEPTAVQGDSLLDDPDLAANDCDTGKIV